MAYLKILCEVNMEEYIYYNNLYDCYHKLLTDKQKNYFEDYYFSNLSLSEIAHNYNVSRNAVHKQLQIIIKKLGIYKNKIELESILEETDINKIKTRIENII